jgi:hypothetical protein
MGTAASANANPYANSRTQNVLDQPEYAQLDSAYAVPDISVDAPYTDEPGWAPHLRLSAQETPDASRLGQQPLRQSYPDPRDPDRFFAEQDADKAKRNSVVDIHATGWEEGRGIAASDRRWADNPRRTPPPDIRVTQRLSPRSYSYVRPFGTILAKAGLHRFNQQHFSMADHRREYPAPDMGAVRTARNTYRLDPTPWDTDLVDLPPNQIPAIPQSRIQSVEVSSPSRSYRLD